MESNGSIHIDYSKYEHWKYEKFARFVNNMLLRRDTYLHTFKLHFKHYHPVNFKDVRTWIGYAVKHNVKVLDVNLSGYDKTVLPRCIFTCRSLQELNLSMGEAPEDDLEHEGLLLPDMIKLPSLKRLTLCDVEVGDICLMQIIARSPLLEDVHLINCAQYLELVDSKVLKRLTINGCIGGDKGLTIAAPQLVHFECTGWPLEDISWRERPSLESAHIDTLCSGRTFDGQSDLTGIVLHAKRLALCGSDIKAMLEKELRSCPVFDNLVTLEIGGWCLTNDLYVVVRFLQLSPRLEKLTLRQRKLNKVTKGEGASSMPIAGMTFMCPLLETVIIQCSKDDDEIEKTVNAMVGYGISLEKIQVIFYEDIERAKRWGMSLEQMKEHDILEKARKEKENQERLGNSKAGSDDSDDDNDEMEDEDDEDDEDEMEDDDDEMDDDDDDF
ncbi:unnamed protein product [Urochloa decumbens]|uniref:At1g61320/AtMIF1 LRR domain-containing protein n=1 Tax=Urochloa decumbens TaxID=240449 RepID=A0ABC8Z2X1_9POAL